MIATRPDWCISRQRVWGVPIIVFYCEACSEPFTDKRALDSVVEQFREHTADVWYSKSVEELIGSGWICGKCGHGSFRKETDILDVWFDSGSSHLAVLQPENGLRWPADMYLEGGDQYRGWFQSSLLIGVGLKGDAPYRESTTHGWTLDADGRAMSKSLGNTIEPEEIIKKYGADLLRLWVASVDFTEDVRLSDTILTRLSEAYRKLRNTFRYALGNLGDFDPARDGVSGGELTGVDAWILTRTADLVQRCTKFYQDYAFHKVYRAIYDFATTDLSALYFDISKSRLYTSGPRSRERRSGQTALYRITEALVRLLAPVLSYTCEEVWRHSKPDASRPESVHLAYFPEAGMLTEGFTDRVPEAASDWERLLPVREQVFKSIDGAREEKIIGSSLEAAVTLNADAELHALLSRHSEDLPDWFIVSHVELKPTAGAFTVEVDRARGEKCERCWKYKTDVGSNADFPTACASCAAVIPEFLDS